MGASQSVNTEPMYPFDLEAYTGKWYEIARTRNFFQNNCVRNTQAQYTLPGEVPTLDERLDRPDREQKRQPIQPPPMVHVLNSCVRENGSLQVATGTAEQLEPMTGAFFVKFDQVPWFVQLNKKANYRVVYTDYSSVAVVTNETGRLVWILSRQPSLPPENLQDAMRILADRNVDLSRLEFTEQEQ